MVATVGETGRESDKQNVSYVINGKKRKERPKFRSVYIKSRNAVPSRKGCALLSEDQGKQQMSTPPPPRLDRYGMPVHQRR